MASALKARAQQAQAAQAQAATESGIPPMQLRMMANAVKGIQKNAQKGQTSSVPEALKALPKTKEAPKATNGPKSDTGPSENIRMFGTKSEFIKTKAKNEHAALAGARANQNIINKGVQAAAKVEGLTKAERKHILAAQDDINSPRSQPAMMAAVDVALANIKDAAAKSKARAILKKASNVHSKK
jgi:hypothetical protein